MNDVSKNSPSMALLAQLSDDIKAAYERGVADGYDKGFSEGQAKQAILELRARDAFLAKLRAETVHDSQPV